MSSGFQEILLIVVIILAILFIPRMMAPQKRQKPKPARPMRRLLKLSVKWRIALVSSLLWLMGAALYFQPWHGKTEKFMLFGIGPVLIGWCITWVIAGFGAREKN